MPIEPNPGQPNWPADWQGCTFTGKYVNLAGEPMSGFMRFTINATAVISIAHSTVVIPSQKSVALDADGEFSITVPASDDPDVNPTGFTYTVKEDFPGGRTYEVEAPLNQIVDLTTVAPVPSSTGEANVRGPSAYEVWLAAGNVGTINDFWAFLATNYNPWYHPIYVLESTETELDIPPGFPSTGLVFKKA